MKRLTLLLLVILNTAVTAQTKPANLTMAFLNESPVIDAIPDPATAAIPFQKFPYVSSTGSSVKSPEARFRVAYGTGFFYLYVEFDSDSLVSRDRGYQNGDGLILLIGKPVEGHLPTKEFFEMGFTVQDEQSSNWQSKFIWYRNVDLSFKRLQETSFNYRKADHKICLEIMIPWSEVYPYHPWITKELAFNLTAVKASGTRDKIYYSYCDDDFTGSEQKPRNYVLLEPAAPSGDLPLQSYAILSKNHITEGENIKIRFAVLSPDERQYSLRIAGFSGEQSRLFSKNVDFQLHPGVNVMEREISLTGLQAGGYHLEWNSVSGNSKGVLNFTVLPSATPDDLAAQLEKKKDKLSAGTYSTLRYLIRDVSMEINRLKDDETAYEPRTQLESLQRLMDNKDDVLKNKKGIFRRGFFSTVDSTYRPYSIKVPDNYDPAKRYPLLVYLHGSGQDDRGMLESLPEFSLNCIQIAPNGRGTSNCYTTDHAQEDIEEAIRDVIRNYRVDTTKIILAGFSMGGYGVYRTFYEHPSRYRALAVFSGSPDVATRWIGHDQPDFLKEEYLKPFTGIPVFIFHGSNDFNLPVTDTRLVVDKLKKAGSDVTFVEEPIGHERMGSGSVEKFNQWLGRLSF